MKYKLFWKVVENQLLGTLIVVAVFAIALILLPVWLPANFLLKKMGRRGFIIKNRDGSFEIDLNVSGFKKV